MGVNEWKGDEVTQKRDIKSMVVKALRALVDEYPQIVSMLDDPADRLLIETQLKDWRDAVLNDDKPDIMHIPGGLVYKVNEMLSYAKNEDDVKTVFDDVLEFFKQDEGIENSREWHERFSRHTSGYQFNDDDWEITQDDIDDAVKAWNKLMPDYKGMLDADVENTED